MPFTTAADDKFRNIFPNFRKKEGMIFHENHLKAGNSHEYHALFVVFEKAARFEICTLLQIIGGTLWVNITAGYATSCLALIDICLITVKVITGLFKIAI